MKISSEEIAKLANVSRSTVSRVINNYSNVPDETRRRVMEVIEKYNYHPHPSARVLAGKANQMILLCISDYNDGKNRWRGTESLYFIRMIAALVSQSKEYGYLISVFIVTEEADYGKIENMFFNREVCAGIFIGFEFPFQISHMNRLIMKGFSMVIIDPGTGVMEAENVRKVFSENLQAGYMATSYLLKQGHRYIAHLAGDHRMSSQDRLKGYEKAMKEADIPEESIWIARGNFESNLSYQSAVKLMENHLITAIFAGNDLMAVCALRAARDLGRHVPENIAIVGCDYTVTYRNLGFDLTSIELSVDEIAARAVKAALGMESEQNIYCKATFHKGSSA